MVVLWWSHVANGGRKLCGKETIENAFSIDTAHVLQVWLIHCQSRFLKFEAFTNSQQQCLIFIPRAFLRRVWTEELGLFMNTFLDGHPPKRRHLKISAKLQQVYFFFASFNASYTRSILLFPHLQEVVSTRFSYTYQLSDVDLCATKLRKPTIIPRYISQVFSKSLMNGPTIPNSLHTGPELHIRRSTLQHRPTYM